MSKPTLTIGMAMVEDFSGSFFTVSSILLNNPDIADRIEYIVVDNKPGTAHSRDTQTFLAQIDRHNNRGTRYIPMPTPQGTAAPRDRVFKEATGDVVICMDNHVLLTPGALSRTLDFFERNPDFKGLVQGPLVMSNFDVCDHFDNYFRGNMLGIWGGSWVCCEGGLRFTPHQLPDHSDPNAVLENGERKARALPLTAYSLNMAMSPVTYCPKCGKQLPQDLSKDSLLLSGYRRASLTSDEEPYEIPGQGLGVFGCRKDAWLGFNPHARGFGGEEMTIHRKYLQAGHSTLCLPWLRWWHRFGRPEGTRYPNSPYMKCRNYVLNFQELGLPLDDIEEEFVRWQGTVTPDQYAYLLSDPIRNIAPPQKATNTAAGQRQPSTQTLDSLFTFVKGEGKRDLHQHADRLRDYAAKCPRIVSITKRREIDAVLAAACLPQEAAYADKSGKPSKQSGPNEQTGQRTLQCFAMERDEVWYKNLLEAANKFSTEGVPGFSRLSFSYQWLHLGAVDHRVELPSVPTTESASLPVLEKIPETDMLVIHSQHTFARLNYELSKFAPSVKRFIVLFGTQGNGESGEDGGPGLFDAIQEFLATNPTWFPVFHTAEQYGMTVLGCLPHDRPNPPVNKGVIGCGPGIELKRILKACGINPAPTCDCNAKSRQMDQLGSKGTKERREQFIKELNAGKARWGWEAVFKAAGTALFTQPSLLLAGINPLDPIPGLLDEAIRRSEQKGC